MGPKMGETGTRIRHCSPWMSARAPRPFPQPSGVPVYRLLPLLFSATVLLGQRHDDVVFRHQGTVASGYSVYLLGDLDALGGGNLARSLRMIQRTPGNWELTVRLPVNTTYQYSYHQRATLNPTLQGNPSHGTLLAGPMVGASVTRAIAPSGKRILGHVPLPSARLHWRQGSGAWQVTPLTQLGAGRTAGEWLYEAASIGNVGLPIEFYFTDGSGAQRLPASGSYGTPLDAFFLQDGHVFTYRPAANVSPHQRDYVPSSPPSIFSTRLNQSRTFRVMLPRGYAQHTWKRYPVLYCHDGPWMFDPGNPILYFNDVIDPDGDTLAGLVQRGEMGECILVAVDWGTTNAALAEVARARDYLPPGSGHNYGSGYVAGAANVYADFLIHELKPWIDANYRTQPGRDTTFTAGFSFGGVVSAYLGWDYGATFSRVGLFSPSFWVPSFPQRLQIEPLRAGLRTYMDSGFDNFSYTAQMRDNWLGRAAPYRLEGELRYAFDPVSTAHTPTEVNGRLPAMGRFLWPATEETNEFLFGAVPYGASSGPNPIDLSWLPGTVPQTGSVSAASNGSWVGFFGVGTSPGTAQVAGLDVWIALDPAPFVAGIAAGGSGVATLPVGLSSTALAGLRLFVQVVRLDPAGLSGSNGLELNFAR